MTTANRVLLCSILILFFFPQVYADVDYTIKLKTGNFIPAQTDLSQNKNISFNNKHVLVQFDRPITETDKDNLYNDGIEVLEYIPNFTYTAKINKDIDQRILDQNNIRYIGQIDPEDKISPLITNVGIGDWARRGGDLVYFTLVFHADEDIYDWADKLVTEYDAELIGFDITTNAFEIILPEPAYFTLATYDEILWIEQIAPPQEEHNNSARQNTGAETLQAYPYSLSGSGVWVAEWDGGHADIFHDDMIGRIQYGDAASVAEHATHVAGTVIGNGYNSGGNYRGMAPSARLVSYLWWGSSSEIINEYGTAINTHGAKISTNSWGLGVGDPATEASCQSTLGNYYNSCATIDNMVRGELYDPISICWSAGNQRGYSTKYCGYLGWTYGTIGVYGTSKNTITVGAINSNNSSMTSFSSWGPCDDGRIKPDVVGPGCQTSEDYGLTSCAPGGGYTTMCGTSMSAPAVAGTIALLHQQYNNVFGTDSILPSTIKGILINSAEDLGNEGPDYQYGHGKVDGVAAINKISIGEPSYFENEISTGIVHTFDMTVTNPEMLRVTLVWDDPGGTAISGGTMINDLDLALIDPFSYEEYPLVLDPEAPFAEATQDYDRVNNVETVQIMNPIPGLWKARVTGYNVAEGPQKYSLIFNPDSSHTPGNLNALAVFPDEDLEDQPGVTRTIDFWVVNVGAAYDSLVASIDDNNMWLNGTVTDSLLILEPYDSAFFQVSATIPPSSLAGDNNIITCTATSLLNEGVIISASVEVTAGAYYDLAIEVPLDNEVSSPDVVPYNYTISNNGNTYDLITVIVNNESDWIFNPAFKTVNLPPFSDSTLSIMMTVPPAVEHLLTNTVNIISYSSGSMSDTGSFVVTVLNENQPPSLITPTINTYTQNGMLTFEWSGVGDSYNLYISTDQLITNIVRLYTGLTSTTFTIPVVDSLTDDQYYWGVRKYVGLDSSSLQAEPGAFLVDNIKPNNLIQTYPINNEYVKFKSFGFQFTYTEKATNSEIAPEYNILDVATDSLFTNNLSIFEPIPTLSYTLPDTIAEGRWYWRLQRADSAGNLSDKSSYATFILDSKKPAIPVQLLPVDNSEIKGDVLFKWDSGEELPPYEFSPEYYRFQLFEGSSTLVFDTTLYPDSLILTYDRLVNGAQYLWRVLAMDEAGNTSQYQTPPDGFTYINFICGDINGDTSSEPGISDLTYLVNYLFNSGSAPNPLEAGSVNCDEEVGISDITFFADYLFNNGPPPCCQ